MTVVQQSIHVCDFCGKSQDDVSRIVAGPKADICDECIELAMSVILEIRIQDRAKQQQDGKP
ncbi:ClpX C4-type zinc finger protein [Aquitalea pelogenes]|uniref:ClpX C4-type zinc finger protein n=1 Tax=Aquitalea pelogenes TaxID=1293573 RepID=UPI0035AF68C8